MKTQSPDTHPEIEAVQVALHRRASVARRFGVTRRLSRHVIALSRRAIRRMYPKYSEKEIKLAFFTLHYGPQIGERVRDYLSRRAR